jgi:hypothetical protein
VIRFNRLSEDSLRYRQRGTSAGGELLHAEVGIWRLGARLRSARRTYALDDDVLVYEIHMAARDVPLTKHVWATLRLAD